jgi:DNA-binding IclR family transcriptional regulator
VSIPTSASDRRQPDDADGRSWTFLTNHAHVLIAISRDPALRQRDISELVGITEGAVQRILHELEHDGYIARERVGRRNRYSVLGQRPLRHPLEAGHTIEEIIHTVNRNRAGTG